MLLSGTVTSEVVQIHNLGQIYWIFFHNIIDGVAVTTSGQVQTQDKNSNYFSSHNLVMSLKLQVFYFSHQQKDPSPRPSPCPARKPPSDKVIKSTNTDERLHSAQEMRYRNPTITFSFCFSEVTIFLNE